MRLSKAFKPHRYSNRRTLKATLCSLRIVSFLLVNLALCRPACWGRWVTTRTILVLCSRVQARCMLLILARVGRVRALPVPEFPTAGPKSNLKFRVRFEPRSGATRSCAVKTRSGDMHTTRLKGYRDGSPRYVKSSIKDIGGARLNIS